MSPARVTVDKHLYITAEHAWNGVKADNNNDPLAADLIRKTICPYEAKRIGDRVRVTKAWNKCQYDVMFEIVLQKVEENPYIKKKLVDTGTRKLHQATRLVDFGIGAGLHSRAAKQGTWTGQDILGQIWEKIRDDLLLQATQD